MIKTRKGETVIEGNIAEICADLAVIVDSANEALTEEIGAEEAKKEIMKAVEYGLMSDDELKHAMNETANKALCELTEALDEFKKFMEGMMKNGGK